MPIWQWLALGWLAILAAAIVWLGWAIAHAPREEELWPEQYYREHLEGRQ